MLVSVVIKWSCVFMRLLDTDSTEFRCETEEEQDVYMC